MSETDLSSVGYRPKSIRIKRLGLVIGIITAIISLLILLGVFFSFQNYKRVLKASDQYREWQKYATDMREASDYLTEQARAFVTTGNAEYMTYYFNEIETTKRREKSLEYIKENFSDDSAITDALNAALTKSNALMQTEFRAMRLRIEADGVIPNSTWHEQIVNADLSQDADADNAEKKIARAVDILYNQDYAKVKAEIVENTNICLKLLEKELNRRQNTAVDNMDLALVFEVVMVGVFVIYTVVIMIVTNNQIFQPIMRSVPFIKNDMPMPVEGAQELRLLANTYNKMYESHHSNRNNLEFKTEHDPLTGALNRRALDKFQLDGQHDIAFLIIDIDNFKKVNDTYGHQTGDKMLVQVVSYLRLYLRSIDKIFRIGGDEFAAIIMDVDEKSKDIIKDKIDNINRSLMNDAPQGLPSASLSVGVAFGNAVDQQLISNADAALYQRKNGGKAGVTFYE